LVPPVAAQKPGDSDLKRCGSAVPTGGERGACVVRDVSESMIVVVFIGFFTPYLAD
jgi:hypothetical protein